MNFYCLPKTSINGHQLNLLAEIQRQSRENMTQATNKPVQVLQKIDSVKPNVEGIQHPQELFAQLQRLTKAGIWTIDLATMQILVSDEMYRLHRVPLDTTVYYEEFLEKMCIPEDRKITENGRIRVITQKFDTEPSIKPQEKQSGFLRT